jgi:DNA-binding phage protein
MTDLATQLREAIAEDARTHYAIARDAGIEPDALYRFMAGKDLYLGTVSKIATVLGLQLAPVKKSSRRK